METINTITKSTIQMELINATANDFKVFAGWTSDGLRKNYVRKIGQIFWLRSKITNLFDGPYIFTESTNVEDLKIYLQNDMVYIPLHPLDAFDKKIKIQTIKEEEIKQAV